MKDVFLDTHAFLWFVTDDPRLGEKAASRMADAGTRKHLSLVSVWEIAIKSQLNKLRLGMEYEEFVREYITDREVNLVPIELGHLAAYTSLPLHHRDPFDRLLIAQAITLGFPILTRDPNFPAYAVEVIWD